MYRILHVFADYLQCSFEFENMKTGEHVMILCMTCSLCLSCSLIMSLWEGNIPFLKSVFSSFNDVRVFGRTLIL